MNRKAVKKYFASNLFRFSAVIVLVALVVIFAVFKAGSVKGETTVRNKCFKSIEIEEGDSLWSIAYEYSENKDDASICKYILELKKMNGLNSDTIHTGNYLVVSYYVD